MEGVKQKIGSWLDSFVKHKNEKDETGELLKETVIGLKDTIIGSSSTAQETEGSNPLDTTKNFFNKITDTISVPIATTVKSFNLLYKINPYLVPIGIVSSTSAALLVTFIYVDKFMLFSNSFDSLTSDIEESYLAPIRKRLIPKYSKNCDFVLELAVSTGNSIPYYDSSVKHFIGVERSNAILKVARRKAQLLQLASSKSIPSKIDFLHAGSMDRLSTLLDESFDLVVFFSVYNSFYNFENCFKEISRVLKDGGVMIFVFRTKTTRYFGVKDRLINMFCTKASFKWFESKDFPTILANQCHSFSMDIIEQETQNEFSFLVAKKSKVIHLPR